MLLLLIIRYANVWYIASNSERIINVIILVGVVRVIFIKILISGLMYFFESEIKKMEKKR